MLDGITDARLRFRDPAGMWRDDWAAVQPDRLPSAVELTVIRAGAPLRLLLLVGPGATPEPDVPAHGRTTAPRTRARRGVAEGIAARGGEGGRDGHNGNEAGGERECQ